MEISQGDFAVIFYGHPFEKKKKEKRNENKKKEKKKERSFLVFSTYKTFPAATGLIADFSIGIQETERRKLN